jgi:hypothetical protein
MPHSTSLSTAPDEPLTVAFADYTGDGTDHPSKNNSSNKDNTFKIKRPDTELDYIHELSPSLNSNRSSNKLSSFLPESSGSSHRNNNNNNTLVARATK